MASTDSIQIARRAQAIYDTQLKTKLEDAHPDEFVAIEPDSGEFFLGKTLSEAIQTARTAHPDRIPFTIRVGHPSTVELGAISRN
jgi:hypothetical protein